LDDLKGHCHTHYAMPIERYRIVAKRYVVGGWRLVLLDRTMTSSYSYKLSICNHVSICSGMATILNETLQPADTWA